MLGNNDHRFIYLQVYILPHEQTSEKKKLMDHSFRIYKYLTHLNKQYQILKFMLTTEKEF